MCQNVIDHDEHGGRRSHIGHNTLRIFLCGFRAADLRRKQVGVLQHFGMNAADGSADRSSVPSHAAHDLPGILSVAAVDVDEFLALMKSLMAELPRLIVIHAAQQQYHFLRPLGRIGIQLPFLRLDQFHQIRQLFNKAGNILCLHSKHSGIPLCQHAGFIFTQVCGDKVLPVQVLWLDNIPIADDKSGRTIQHMKQAKHIRGNIASCAAGPQHDHLDRAIRWKLHRNASSRRSRKLRLSGFLNRSDFLLRILTCVSHSLGNDCSNPSITILGSMDTKESPQKIRALMSG